MSYVVFDWLLARQAEIVIIPHEKFRPYLPFITDAKRIKVVPSLQISRTIQVSESNRTHNWFHKGMSSSSQPPMRWLYLGRLDPRKGIKLLIRRLSEVTRQFPMNQYSLTIAGRGCYEEGLRKYARKQGVDTRVSFIGWVDKTDHADLFKSHDVLLVPSFYEPYGNVVTEALELGLPVVSSNNVADQGQIMADFKQADSLLNALSDIDDFYGLSNDAQVRMPETMNPQAMISSLIQDLFDS
jgi:glycosyltransferase involved in cell wall biosynthesis